MAYCLAKRGGITLFLRRVGSRSPWVTRTLGTFNTDTYEIRYSSIASCIQYQDGHGVCSVQLEVTKRQKRHAEYKLSWISPSLKCRLFLKPIINKYTSNLASRLPLEPFPFQNNRAVLTKSRPELNQGTLS